MADKHDAEFSPLEEMGYETEDLQVEKSWLAAIYFYAGIFVMAGIAWLVIWLINPDAIVASQKTERKAMPAADQPLLQGNFTAHHDMVELRADEREKMDGEDAGAMPVEDAMDAVLREGLPTRANADLPEDFVQGGAMGNIGTPSVRTAPDPMGHDDDGDDHHDEGMSHDEDDEDHIEDEDHEEGEH